MEINELPVYDSSDNPTGCCPRFHPENWDGQDLHFKDKLFVRARTRSIAHIPLNMGSVFKKTFAAIEKADALPEKNFVVMSRELSPWRAEHIFAVSREVPGCDTIEVSGDFDTSVFEGPYKNMRHWCDEMKAGVEGTGKSVEETWFFYTTCPRCAKSYGKNYVVGLAQTH